MRPALIVMSNVPQAAIGSVVFLLIFNWPTSEALAAAHWWEWPRVWVEATSLSVAHCGQQLRVDLAALGSDVRAGVGQLLGECRALVGGNEWRQQGLHAIHLI